MNSTSNNNYQVLFRQLEVKPQVDCTGGMGMLSLVKTSQNESNRRCQ